MCYLYSKILKNLLIASFIKLFEESKVSEPWESFLKKYICIHGHFYQPPRENPWLGEIEQQESAAPFHDWNQRVTQECYAPNTAARVLDAQKRIADIVNNYTSLSFNFGPTLLDWLAKKKPAVYQEILESDKQGAKNFSGHGPAIAQCYNHMIMPLANERDKRTQIFWGIKDFQYRFGRNPEGMWLPETAVDLKTLDILADQGITYVVLSPYQAKSVRKIGEKDWQNASGGAIDTRRSYACRLPSGRTIAIFFYDGVIAKDVAFRNLLNNGQVFAERLLGAFDGRDEAQIVHIATDGESYGHHHRFGEMALATCLKTIMEHHDVELTVYGEFLEKFSPQYEVEIFENSSWSCVHGIERWRSDCGCRSGGAADWHQEWRAPLRDALDLLRDRLIPVYEEATQGLLKDCWKARDEYIDIVLNADESSRRRFVRQQALHKLSAEERIQIWHALEMQRNALLMYTSCGWFFNEISGIETVQILRYAAKAAQLAREISGKDLMLSMWQMLKKASSNRMEYRDGAGVFEKEVLPAVVNMPRVAGNYALMSLFEDYPEAATIYGYTARSTAYEVVERGERRLVFGRVVICSEMTAEEKEFMFIVVSWGGMQMSAAVNDVLEEKHFEKIRRNFLAAFEADNEKDVVALMKKNFHYGPFTVEHVFKDDQARILYQFLDISLGEVESALRRINTHNEPIIRLIKRLRMPIPKILSHTVSIMLNSDLFRSVGEDPIDFRRLKELVSAVVEWDLEIDQLTLAFLISRRVSDLLEPLKRRGKNQKSMKLVSHLLKMIAPLGLHIDLGKAQNSYFSIRKKYYDDIAAKAQKGHRSSQNWVVTFEELGGVLNIARNHTGVSSSG